MSEEVKAEGLKPCPFCGATWVKLAEYDGCWCVRCCECGSKGAVAFWNQSQAALDWNRRTEVLPQKNTKITQKETDVDFERTPGMPDRWQMLVNKKPIAVIWGSPIGLKLTWFDESQTLFTREAVLDFVNQRLYLEVK